MDNMGNVKWPSRLTLWALLWLGIILIVIIILSSTSEMMVKNRRTYEKSAILGIQLGIKNFQVEYNTWPLLPGTLMDIDLETEVSGPLLACLMGQKICGNERGVRFIEPIEAQDGKRGLIISKADYQLVDSWGHDYRVIVDLTHDAKIDNPDLKNAASEIRADLATQQLPISVAVMCAGPDGRFFTRDDIVSWRETPPMPLSIKKTLLQPRMILTLVGWLLIVYSTTGLIATRYLSNQQTWPY
jgi:hypothetical protein